MMGDIDISGCTSKSGVLDKLGKHLAGNIATKCFWGWRLSMRFPEPKGKLVTLGAWTLARTCNEDVLDP